MRKQVANKYKRLTFKEADKICRKHLSKYIGDACDNCPLAYNPKKNLYCCYVYDIEMKEIKNGKKNKM